MTHLGDLSKDAILQLLKIHEFSQKTTGMLHYHTEIDMIFWPTSYQFNKCILKQVLNVILNIFKAIFPFSFRRQ